MALSDIKSDVEAYYADKIGRHGPTPKGVDWRDQASQSVRFERFDRIFAADSPVSVCDLGCGYGAHARHLLYRPGISVYRGVDLSPAMIAAARESSADLSAATFEVGSRPVPADVVVASGIFNVKLGVPDRDWRDYVMLTIDQMWDAARVAIGYNVLTTCSDPERRRPDLFYADPAWLWGQHARRHGGRILMDQSYDLYEVTVLLWKGGRSAWRGS